LSIARKIALLAAIPVLAGVAYGVWLAVSVAPIAAGYTARQMCSCRFVSRRPAASCEGDLPGIMALVTRWHEDGTAVSAEAFGAFPARAVFEEGFGCHVAR
jgi:hypothetical protein